ncbi:hypothetical protein HOLleu_01190 [Holothuria leucospilota]|uniref:Uncharacterized protein n=1 Tax=Holothuria leucospilota TaxID=206669 RepID=A0A9Q1CP13_HOLLE|nr:hypothetical protein HOLleu_01190 [Holothuria leucospilota]
MENFGLEQYETYVEERLVNQTVPITDPIKRNNLNLLSRPPLRENSRKQLQMSPLKNNCSLFSRLHIASQICHGDLDDFFQHENQACLPSLSQIGGLRTGTKSDLMPCLENLVPVKEDLSTSRIQVNILDGAGIINMLRPGTAKTVQGYATDVFVPYVTSQLQHVDRLDIVWDLYMTNSLKADTRSKRGKGVRDESSHQVQFLETGKSFSASTTRRSCSHSWLLKWQTLTPTNISSPHMTLAFFAPIARTCQL